AAVNFDGWISILLHGEAAHHRCVTTAEIDKDLRVVLGFDFDAAAVDFAFWNRHAHERCDALRWTKQSSEARDRINPQIKKTPAARFIKPLRPPWARPA